MSASFPVTGYEAVLEALGRSVVGIVNARAF
jgi:hypothetical protein